MSIVNNPQSSRLKIRAVPFILILLIIAQSTSDTSARTIIPTFTFTSIHQKKIANIQALRSDHRNNDKHMNNMLRQRKTEAVRKALFGSRGGGSGSESENENIQKQEESTISSDETASFANNGTTATGTTPPHSPPPTMIKTSPSTQAIEKLDEAPSTAAEVISTSTTTQASPPSQTEEAKVSKLRAAVFPIYGSEVQKFFLMGAIKFFVIMALTLTRDTKDTLVVTQCGAEAIAFLKVSVVVFKWIFV